MVAEAKQISSASSVLKKHASQSSWSILPVGIVKAFSHKVSGKVTETVKNSLSGAGLDAIITFGQYGELAVIGKGVGANKKEALKQAALQIIAHINAVVLQQSGVMIPRHAGTYQPKKGPFLKENMDTKGERIQARLQECTIQKWGRRR